MTMSSKGAALSRRVLVWLLAIGWLWMAAGWALFGGEACAGCSLGMAGRALASTPFLLTLYVFPYNLFLPLYAGLHSYVASACGIFVLCAVLGAAALRWLPVRLSWLQFAVVAVAWTIGSLGGLALIMAGASIP